MKLSLKIQSATLGRGLPSDAVNWMFSHGRPSVSTLLLLTCHPEMVSAHTPSQVHLSLVGPS